jgi:hypothetical protein
MKPTLLKLIVVAMLVTGIVAAPAPMSPRRGVDVASPDLTSTRSKWRRGNVELREPKEEVIDPNPPDCYSTRSAWSRGEVR